MVRSPNRMQTKHVFALIEQEPNVSKADLAKIEKAGCCKLGKKLSEDLVKILNSFVLNKAIEKKGYTRSDVYNHLIRISESAYFLNEIFGDQQDHAKRVATFNVDDEFEQTIHDVGFELRARWDLVPKYYSQNLDLSKEDHIDFEYLADNCLIISHAAKRAIKKMDDDAPQDIGGREAEFLKNRLFEKLSAIYEQASGKKKARERFIMACVNCIPENYRPEVSTVRGSIDQQLNRLKSISS